MSKVLIKDGLDLGHGGNDPGAVNGKRKEADDVLKLGKALEKYVEEKSGGKIDLQKCRKDNKTLSLNDRSSWANRNKYKAFISLHRDSSQNESAAGATVRIQPGCFNKDSGKLAKCIAKRIKPINPGNRADADRIVEQNLHVLRETDMPAVLIEVGFISNSNDNKIFDSKFNDLVKAIGDGILEYHNIKPVVNKPSTDPTGISNLKVGDRVKITGSKYATGQNISDWAKKQVHTISKIDKDRALLKEITSWCYLKDLQISTSSKRLEVGMYVQMVGSKWATGQTVPSWVKNNKYKVKQISADTALLDGVISWAYIKDLKY